MRAASRSHHGARTSNSHKRAIAKISASAGPCWTLHRLQCGVSWNGDFSGILMDFGLPNFETPWMDAYIKHFNTKTYHKISRNGKACGWCPRNVTGISQPQFARVCRKCALSLLFESFSFEISRVTQGSSQTYWGSPIGSGTSTRERPGNLTSRALAWGNHWMIALTGYGPKRSEMKVTPT